MTCAANFALLTLLVSLAQCSDMSECHLDDLHAFGWWVNHKNSTHVSPILPETDEQLRSVDLESLKDRPQLSARTNCTPDDSEMASTYSRALCRWHYRVNYDPKRIPSSIAEADCHCPKVTHAVRCAPLAFRMRVLKFDQDCERFVETFESILLACIPVIQVTATAEGAEVGVLLETFENET